MGLKKEAELEYYTWSPDFYVDVLKGGLSSEELRRRTLRLVYTDNYKKYDMIEWDLDNRDGLLTKTEFMALGLLVRFRIGYHNYTQGWRTFVLSRMRGGVGCSARKNPAVSESNAVITFTGRNRNAPDLKTKKKKGKKDSGVAKPTGRGRGKRNYSRGGGATGDIMRLNNLQRDAYYGPTEGERIFSVRHLSDAVKEMAFRMGYPSSKIYIEDTNDDISSVIVPTGATLAEFLRGAADNLGWIYKASKVFKFHSQTWQGAPKATNHIFRIGADQRVLDIALDADIRLPSPKSVKAKEYNPIVRRTNIKTSTADSVGTTNRMAVLYFLDETSRAGPQKRLRDFNLRRDDVIAVAGGYTKTASLKAQKIFLKKNLRAIELSLKVVGDPSIDAGDLAVLKSTGTELVDTTWFIAQAQHIFSGTDYQTNIKLIQPPKLAKKKRPITKRTNIVTKDAEGKVLKASVLNIDDITGIKAPTTSAASAATTTSVSAASSGTNDGRQGTQSTFKTVSSALFGGS
jgi:hypothetical protein